MPSLTGRRTFHHALTSGMSKYGPFTTEEVEHTRTFFSIFLLFLSMIDFHLANVLLARNGDHRRLITSYFLTIIIGVPMYEFVTVVIVDGYTC